MPQIANPENKSKAHLKEEHLARKSVAKSQVVVVVMVMK